MRLSFAFAALLCGLLPFISHAQEAVREALVMSVGDYGEATYWGGELTKLPGMMSADRPRVKAKPEALSFRVVSVANPSRQEALEAVDPESPSGLNDSIGRGKAGYQLTCMACHQARGQGLEEIFPPLAGVDYVTGDARRLIAIMVKGIQGTMTVQGKSYSVAMPSPVSAFRQLKDDQNLADVLNYVRNSFGNKADVITPAFVKKVRAEFASDSLPFTEQTLKSFLP